MSYQSITLVGNVGRDPEMRLLPDGSPVTSFSVATNREYKQVKETTWFRVTVFGKQAEICNQYLKKGSKVLVEGRMTPDKDTGGPRIWKDNAGEAKASFEVTANTVRFLSSTDGNHDTNAQAGGDFAPDDDIPF